MAELADIKNEFIRNEVEEFIERPDEIERTVNTFARVIPEMQDIAAALIDGANHTVDQLTKEALDAGTEALEVMDDGLIAGMGVVGIKFRENFIFVPEVLACARAMKAFLARITGEGRCGWVASATSEGKEANGRVRTAAKKP